MRSATSELLPRVTAPRAFQKPIHWMPWRRSTIVPPLFPSPEHLHCSALLPSVWPLLAGVMTELQVELRSTPGNGRRGLSYPVYLLSGEIMSILSTFRLLIAL